MWKKHLFRIYIDTSVIGGYYDTEFAEWSKKLIGEFREGDKVAVISDITLDELEEAPAKVRDIIETIPGENLEILMKDEEVDFLADLYVQEEAITNKYYADALHIALATIHKVDVLVSWNFKHIVNFNRIRKYNGVNLTYGYQTLEIRSPREVLDE